MSTAPSLLHQLRTVAAAWGRHQYRLVVLAAELADGVEWLGDGSPTPAHWLASVADVEVCTTREWIRIGKLLRTLPKSADAFEHGRISYSKVRTLTRIATPANEADLVPIAERTPAGELARALAPSSVVEHLAPTAFFRALIHDAEGRPIDASGRHRHPSARQRRVVKERDRVCVDCGRHEVLQCDHVPEFEISRRTLVDELRLRCAVPPCSLR